MAVSKILSTRAALLAIALALTGCGDEQLTGGSGGGRDGGPDARAPGDGSVPPEQCELGTTDTQWATDCASEPEQCTPGEWTAPPQGSNGHPLRTESEHFAVYWFTPDQELPGALEGLASPPSAAQLERALATLEMLWDRYFGPPILFPEPYCDSSTKWKVTVHLDDFYPLWGGGWADTYMGLWIGPGSLEDDWGLGHEFMHGIQSTTQAFPECGGTGCWIWESHANWMPHQVWRDNPHCSEMLVNTPHLYYGNTRNRYCNWQFFEFLKDKHCYAAVNDMWAYEAPIGQRDPWQKLMLARGWDIEDLNDLFGEWAMHNITWDYRDPPPANPSDQGDVYRTRFGSIENPEGRAERMLRLTRLEALDDGWRDHRRFVSPYYWAPQRWGYNVVRLHPEPGADSVRVTFRGVVQSGADSGWRWGLVATDSELTTSRYSPLQSGVDGTLHFCVKPGENLYLVAVATPTEYQKLEWTQPSDGPAYPSIYRYPYMVQLEGAWPTGFRDGEIDPCPDGTEPHDNGGGCAPLGTPASVYVGPYARILGGIVTGDARIEDQATVINGTVSGGTVGALSLIGAPNRPFNVSDSATVQATFYPLGWFRGNSVSGSARLVGDLEYQHNKSSNTFYGFVPEAWDGGPATEEVTIAPPYIWRP